VGKRVGPKAWGQISKRRPRPLNALYLTGDTNRLGKPETLILHAGETFGDDPARWRTARHLPMPKSSSSQPF
jgi:hypothetical protein